VARAAPVARQVCDLPVCLPQGRNEGLTVAKRDRAAQRTSQGQRSCARKERARVGWHVFGPIIDVFDDFGDAVSNLVKAAEGLFGEVRPR
jgi:hypothetical protein